MSDDTRSFKIEQPGGVLRRIRCARTLPWIGVRREIANVCKYVNPIVRYKCDDSSGSVIAIDCDAVLERAFMSIRPGQALRVMVMDGAAIETKAPPSPIPMANPIPRMTLTPTPPAGTGNAVTEVWHASSSPMPNPIPLVVVSPSASNQSSSTTVMTSTNNSGAPSPSSITVSTQISSSPSAVSPSSIQSGGMVSTSSMISSMSGSAVVIGTDIKSQQSSVGVVDSNNSNTSSSGESKRSGPMELPNVSPSLHDRTWMMTSNRGEGVPSSSIPQWSAYTGAHDTNDTFDPDSTNGDDQPDEGEAVLDDGSRSVHIPAVSTRVSNGNGNGITASGNGSATTSPASSTSTSGILNNPATLLALAQSTMLGNSTSLEGSMILQLATQLQTSFSDLAKIRDEIKADREALMRERAEQQASIARERAQMATERAQFAAVVAASNSSQILQRSRSPTTNNGNSSDRRPSSAERRRHERQLRRSLGKDNSGALPPRQPGVAPVPIAPASAVTPIVPSNNVTPTPPFSPLEPGASPVVVPGTAPSPAELLRQIEAHVARGVNGGNGMITDLPSITPRVLRTATADDSASGASSSTDVQTPQHQPRHHHLHHHHGHHSPHRNHNRSPAPIRRRDSSGSSSSGMPVMSSISRQSSVDSASERGDDSPQTDDTDNDDELIGEIEGDMGISPSVSASPSPMVRPIVLSSQQPQQQPSPSMVAQQSSPSLPSMLPPVNISINKPLVGVAVVPSSHRVDLSASVSDDFVRLDNPSAAAGSAAEAKYAGALARLHAAGHDNDLLNIDMLNENNGDVDAVLADYAKFFAPISSGNRSPANRAVLPTPPSA